MKYLITADLHYTLKQYDWVLRMAPEFDVVILAGDLLDIASYVDGRAQTVVVLKYLQRISAVTRLITCSGNHDLDCENAQGERIAKWFEKIRRLGIVADGDNFEIDGIFFTVCPWWDGPTPRAAVGEQLARDAQKRGDKRWAWVYHAPPTGSPTCVSGAKSYGDAALEEWIRQYQPDFVFSGHVHNAPFSEGGSWADRIGNTWVFNAGRELGPEPPHVMLSTDAHQVAWLSISYGGEWTKLDVPLARPLQKLTEEPAWL